MDDLISRKAAIEIASGFCHPANIAKELAKLPSAQPEHTNSCYTNSWCINCKEYDKEKHSCPRFNRVIKQTIDEIYSHAETEAEARFHAEIVRCKDCKNRGDDDCPMRFIEWVEYDDDGYIEHDDIIHDYTKDDGFCDRAERRTDDR